uniref:Uncharacterized protein n=1 Tax=Romanomermis culicivorax TaxID=13658 RepID=A0A915JJE7_ROMCU
MPLMVPMDVQQPQQPSTSTAKLNRYGQPICKPAPYEHSVKRETQQQEEIESHKAHKACTTDKPHLCCTPLPSTSRTKRGKMTVEHMVKFGEQRAKQKAGWSCQLNP